MKYVITILLSLSLMSCLNKDRQNALSLLQEWEDKEILFPKNPVFTIQGKDTVFYPMKEDYKILSYVDSVGCTSCKLRLSDWNAFISQMDSVRPVQFLFFFFPKEGLEIYQTLRVAKFRHPICIDDSDSLNILNHFPREMAYQTFLLDKDNKVLAIGNPVQNPKVKELFMKIIQGKGTVKEENTIFTKIQVKANTLSLGRFNWQEEQKAQFMIYNVGNRPLVINDVTTSCGCTSVDYPKKPVSPGDSISLQVNYKADHPEHFNKTITVYCNTNPSLIQLKIRGDAE